MKRLVWQVAVGSRRLLWDRCLESMRTYAERHGIDYHLQTEPVLRIVPKKSSRSPEAMRLGYLPIFEKFQSFALLGEYDEILVVDADVWAAPRAPNIFEAVPDGAEFAAVIERDMPITNAYARKIDAYARGQYGDGAFPFANMGVRVIRKKLRRLLVGQTPTEFIRRPEFEPYVNGEGNLRWQTEQTLLNVWVRACGAHFQPLGWKWNALFGAVVASLQEAHFVHFFLSDHLEGDDPEVLIRTGKGRARV